MRVMKKIGVTVAVVLLLTACVGAGFVRSLALHTQPLADPATTPAQLPMLQAARPAVRGRVLAVVTSTARVGEVSRLAVMRRNPMWFKRWMTASRPNSS